MKWLSREQPVFRATARKDVRDGWDEPRPPNQDTAGVFSRMIEAAPQPQPAWRLPPAAGFPMTSEDMDRSRALERNAMMRELELQEKGKLLCLAEYIRGLNYGDMIDFAKGVGADPAVVWKWAGDKLAEHDQPPAAPPLPTEQGQ